MKKLLFLLLLLSATVSFSQSSEESFLIEPEYSGEALVFKTFAPVEKQKHELRAKANAALYLSPVGGKMNSLLIVSGAASPNRFNHADTIKLVINYGLTTINPMDNIYVSKCEVNVRKKERSVKTGSISVSLVNSSFKDAEVKASYYFKKYSNKSFLLIIPPGLEPGEYSIRSDGWQHLLLFGVD